MNKYIFGRKINALVHGGDYNPEQWLEYPEILKKDIEYMKKAGINEATLGVFAWAMYEPREGEFHFEWLKKIMDDLYENGIYTILATPSGARPVWLDNKYPEVMRVDQRGVRNRRGFRHNHCLSSPKFREKISIIDRKLAETVGDHPGLLMWHISNEFGGECYCDECKAKFRDYLKKKFDNDIDRLNHEWWTTFWSKRYTDFDQIEPPYTNGETAIMGLNLEWKRFTTQNFSEYMSVEIDTIREFSSRKDTPITTNFMKRFWDIDYRVLAKKLDAISWDSYPAFHNDRESYHDTMIDSAFDNALMRSMKKDRPFMLMESAPGHVNWMEYNKLKRPGVHEQFAIQTVACGSDTVQYFQIRQSRGAAEQFHGAVISHLGVPDTRVFKEVAATGDVLKRLSGIEGSVMKNKAAIVFEWDNWWALENAGGLSRRTKNYDKTCEGYWIRLMEYGVEADIISSEDAFDDYSLIIVPMLYLLKPGVADRLKKFTADGGILLGTYVTGYVNENTLCYLGGFPGDGLGDLFGVTIEETDTLYPSDKNAISISGGKLPEAEWEVRDYAELLRIKDAEILGTYKTDFYKGMPALTCKTYGKGKAYYQAARCDLKDMDGLLGLLLTESGIEHKKLGAGVEYHKRYGKDSIFEFYLNTSDDEIMINIPKGEDLLNGGEVGGDIRIPKKGYVVTERKLENAQKYPSKEEAERLLKEAESCNPGPWGDHSRTAAHCAEAIALRSGMNAEKANQPEGRFCD